MKKTMLMKEGGGKLTSGAALGEHVGLGQARSEEGDEQALAPVGRAVRSIEEKNVNR